MAAKRGGGGAAGKNSWLAADGSKRWGEKFFLLYTPFWLTLCLGGVVPFKLYEVLVLAAVTCWWVYLILGAFWWILKGIWDPKRKI